MQFSSAINTFLCSLFFNQTGIVNAVPRWGKNSKLVLVSLLLTGLLLAALLVAGYYLKTHRKNSKGVRLVSVVKEMCGNLIHFFLMQLRKRVLKIRDMNGLIRWMDTLVNQTKVIFSTSSSQTLTQLRSHF